MVRISKQNQRRNRSPRKRQPQMAIKTGAKKDNLPSGFREHPNAVEGEIATKFFIPKIK